MGVAQALTAIVLGLTAPSASVPQNSDSSALQAVAAACTGATTAAGTTHSELEAMYCGVNVVRRTYHLSGVRGNAPLNRSSLIKANAVRRCGFTHTPCGMSFTRTFRSAGYLPARAFGENLAWGQADLGSVPSESNRNAHRGEQVGGHSSDVRPSSCTVQPGLWATSQG